MRFHRSMLFFAVVVSFGLPMVTACSAAPSAQQSAGASVSIASNPSGPGSETSMSQSGPVGTAEPPTRSTSGSASAVGQATCRPASTAASNSGPPLSAPPTTVARSGLPAYPFLDSEFFKNVMATLRHMRSICGSVELRTPTELVAGAVINQGISGGGRWEFVGKLGSPTMTIDGRLRYATVGYIGGPNLLERLGVPTDRLWAKSAASDRSQNLLAQVALIAGYSEVVSRAAAAMSAPQLLGTDSVAGQTAYHYRYALVPHAAEYSIQQDLAGAASAEAFDASATVSTDLWIDVRYRVLKSVQTAGFDGRSATWTYAVSVPDATADIPVPDPATVFAGR